MKSYFSKISITAFVIIYLFFCGATYLIAYWSTFDFDITNYIDFVDVPKSFIMPVAWGFTYSLMIVLFSFFITANAAHFGIKSDGKFKYIVNEIIMWIISLGILYCIVSFLSNGKLPQIKLAYYIMIAGIVLMFYQSGLIHSLIPNSKLRYAFSVMIFFVPTFIFITGKTNSNFIKKNTKYFEVTDIRIKSDSCISTKFIHKKLLGKLGTYLFLSDTSNQELLVLNLSEIQYIKYKEVGVDTTWFQFKYQ